MLIAHNKSNHSPFTVRGNKSTFSEEKVKADAMENFKKSSSHKDNNKCNLLCPFFPFIVVNACEWDTGHAVYCVTKSIKFHISMAAIP